MEFTPYPATEGSHRLRVNYMQGDLEGPPSSPITVNIRTKGPEFKSVDESGLGGEGPDRFALQFDPLQKKSAEDAASYALHQKTIDGKDIPIKLGFSPEFGGGAGCVGVDRQLPGSLGALGPQSGLPTISGCGLPQRSARLAKGPQPVHWRSGRNSSSGA